jgi:hypothetical protein
MEVYSRGPEQFFFLLHRRGSYIKWRIRSFLCTKPYIVGENFDRRHRRRRRRRWIDVYAFSSPSTVLPAFHPSPTRLKRLTWIPNHVIYHFFFLTYTKTVFCIRFFGTFLRNTADIILHHKIENLTAQTKYCYAHIVYIGGERKNNKNIYFFFLWQIIMWLKIVSRVHTETTVYVLFLDLFTCVQHLYTPYT